VTEPVEKSDGATLRNSRDLAMIAILWGCGLRRAELACLRMEDVQVRQGHWAIVDLIGKGGHVRTVPMPTWVKSALDKWTTAAKVSDGRIFRAVSRHGSRDLRECGLVRCSVLCSASRTRAYCTPRSPPYLRQALPLNGGELEQIQFLLGNVSVLTTERYLGCKQNLEQPVNDRFGPLITFKEVETS